jgi:hypothetical protein
MQAENSLVAPVKRSVAVAVIQSPAAAGEARPATKGA